MEEIKNKFKKYWWSSILTSILFIFIGILLIAFSDAILDVVAYVVGGILLAVGVFNMINVFRNKEDIRIFNVDLIYGILGLIFGFILIINPALFASIIQFFLGFWVVINSIIKLQYTWQLKKNSSDKWIVSLVLSLLILIVGLIMIFCPYESAKALTKTIGVMVIIYSVIDIVESIILRSQIKKLVDEVKEVLEVEKEEEKPTKKKKKA